MKIGILNRTEDGGFDFKKPQGLFNKITPWRGIEQSGPSNRIRTVPIREREREARTVDGHRWRRSLPARVNRALGAMVWLRAGTKWKRGTRRCSPRWRWRPKWSKDDVRVEVAVGGRPACTARYCEVTKVQKKDKMARGCFLQCYKVW
jgi:hypothetical protein